MTLREYVEEVKIFPYSRANFDIVKESIELNIAAMYLDSYNYIQENTIDNSNLICIYTEDIIEEKRKSFIGRLTNFIRRIFSSITRSFNVLYTLASKLVKKAVDNTNKRSSALNKIQELDKNIKRDYDSTFNALKKEWPELYKKFDTGDINTIFKTLDTEDLTATLKETGMTDRQIQFTMRMAAAIVGVLTKVPSRLLIVSRDKDSFMRPFKKIIDMKTITDQECDELNEIIENVINKIENSSNESEFATAEDIDFFEKDFKDLSLAADKAKNNVEHLLENNDIEVDFKKLNNLASILARFTKMMNEYVANIVDLSDKLSTNLLTIIRWFNEVLDSPKVGGEQEDE